MSGSTSPIVVRLELATVRVVPDWHPEHHSFEPFPVYGWVIRHPKGNVLVDTGVGLGNELIDEWYEPELTTLTDALGEVGLRVDEIDLVVLTHLHFDHCGQQAAVDAPVVVQRTEHEAAQAPGYTVEEWAAVPQDRLRLVDGEHELLEGVRLLPTPGHTPGHQSVVVETGERRVVLGGQCAFRASEIRSGVPAETNLHSEEWREAAKESLARIRHLAPVEVQCSHDPEVVRLT